MSQFYRLDGQTIHKVVIKCMLYVIYNYLYLLFTNFILRMGNDQINRTILHNYV